MHENSVLNDRVQSIVHAFGCTMYRVVSWNYFFHSSLRDEQFTLTVSIMLRGHKTYTITGRHSLHAATRRMCTVQTQHTPGTLIPMQAGSYTPHCNAPAPTTSGKVIQNKVPRLWEVGFSPQTQGGGKNYWDFMHTSFPYKNESWGDIFWHSKAMVQIIMVQDPLSKVHPNACTTQSLKSARVWAVSAA